MRDSCEASHGNLYRAAKDETRAAKPEADEASPAAVGKLLTEHMCTGHFESWKMVEFKWHAELSRELMVPWLRLDL